MQRFGMLIDLIEVNSRIRQIRIRRIRIRFTANLRIRWIRIRKIRIRIRSILNGSNGSGRLSVFYYY